jgi:hypothetical protein
MKTKTAMISFGLIALGAALALFLVLSSSPLKAQGLIVLEPEAFVPAYSTVGFAQSQSLQLNISNLGNAQLLPGRCDVLLQFRDQGGNVIAQKSVALQPGQSDFFVLSGTNIGGGARKFARPVVRASTPLLDGNCTALVTHGEIFDTFTGQSVVGVDPQPFLTRQP